MRYAGPDEASNVSDHIRRLADHAMALHPAWPAWTLVMDTATLWALEEELADRRAWSLDPEPIEHGAFRTCSIRTSAHLVEEVRIEPAHDHRTLGLWPPQTYSLNTDTGRISTVRPATFIAIHGPRRIEAPTVRTSGRIA